MSRIINQSVAVVQRFPYLGMFSSVVRWQFFVDLPDVIDGFRGLAPEPLDFRIYVIAGAVMVVVVVSVVVVVVVVVSVVAVVVVVVSAATVVIAVVSAAAAAAGFGELVGVAGFCCDGSVRSVREMV